MQDIWISFTFWFSFVHLGAPPMLTRIQQYQSGRRLLSGQVISGKSHCWQTPQRDHNYTSLISACLHLLSFEVLQVSSHDLHFQLTLFLSLLLLQPLPSSGGTRVRVWRGNETCALVVSELQHQVVQFLILPKRSGYRRSSTQSLLVSQTQATGTLVSHPPLLLLCHSAVCSPLWATSLDENLCGRAIGPYTDAADECLPASTQNHEKNIGLASIICHAHRWYRIFW